MILKWKTITFLLCATGILVIFRPDFIPIDYVEVQRVCACTKCLSEDKQLLLDQSNNSVEPFLTSDYSLPEDAFNWWKCLQNEQCSFNTYNTTVDRLFQFFPHNPDLIKPSPDHCRSCAVVGNSGNLRGSYSGPMIDSHEVVIRMNTGVTKGYEKDVGTKTTHRVMYPESALDLDKTTHLVLFPFKIQDIEWLIKSFTTGFNGTSYMPVKSRIRANKDLVMVVNPAFMRYVHNMWLENKGRYPSTGFMALILALHICDEVHVFGYGADSDGNWSHYFERLEDKELKTGVHPGTQEYDIIQWLAREQKIKFYTGRGRTEVTPNISRYY